MHPVWLLLTMLKRPFCFVRWPNTALKLDESGAVVSNSFDELPLVGSWGRRPLELVRAHTHHSPFTPFSAPL
eukprot:6093696-Pleurochrysis_carterae.AAC.3